MQHKTSAASELKELLTDLLPPHRTYHTMVKPEAQQNLTASLDTNVANESFYFVFNLLNCSFDCINGVEKWLGYSSKEFTVHQYLSCIHPGQAIQFNMIAHSMYRLLCKGVFRLQFATQKYISLVALKHYSGDYFTFKKTTSVFQYDNQNRLLQQLNEFTKIERYEATPLKPRIEETNGGTQRHEFERLTFADATQDFMDKKLFSKTEWIILKHYANNKEVSSRELATELDIEKITVHKFNQRILNKARETFTHPFHDAKEVALYLKREKLFE